MGSSELGPDAGTRSNDAFEFAGEHTIARYELELATYRREGIRLRQALAQAEGLLRQRAFMRPAGPPRQQVSEAEVADCVAHLTPRQRQVLEMVLAGQPSKNIAVDLGISRRTVENHRAEIMKKTGSKSLPALGRFGFVASHTT